MATNYEAMVELEGFEKVRDKHRELFTDLNGSEAQLLKNPALRNELIGRVHDLIDDLREMRCSIKSTAEYEWWSQTVNDCQVAMSTVLDEPMDVRSVVGLSGPVPPLEPARKRMLRGEEVLEFLKEQAFVIGQGRKLATLLQEYGDLRIDLGRIHGKISSTPQEMMSDWNQACGVLAYEVLYGELDAATQLDNESLRHLEAVWLEDVKRLRAYLIWEQEGAEWPSGQEQDHFLQACGQLHEQLLDAQRKAPHCSFSRILNLLNDQYLSEGRLDLSKRPAHDLVERKARRVWEKSKNDNAVSNWAIAEKYARGFYENIAAFLNDRQLSAGVEIAGAMQIADVSGARYELASALEIALLIAYADPDLVEELTGAEEGFV